MKESVSPKDFKSTMIAAYSSHRPSSYYFTASYVFDTKVKGLDFNIKHPKSKIFPYSPPNFSIYSEDIVKIYIFILGLFSLNGH